MRFLVCDLQKDKCLSQVDYWQILVYNERSVINLEVF